MHPARRRASVREGYLGVAEDCEGGVDEVVATHGRLDHLVCVATRHGFGYDVPVAHSIAGDWAPTIGSYLSGPYYLLVAALQHMVAQGSGRIVMVVSSDGGPGTTGQSAVGVAASGLVTLVQRTTREVVARRHRERGPGRPGAQPLGSGRDARPEAT